MRIPVDLQYVNKYLYADNTRLEFKQFFVFVNSYVRLIHRFRFVSLADDFDEDPLLSSFVNCFVKRPYKTVSTKQEIQPAVSIEQMYSASCRKLQAENCT